MAENLIDNVLLDKELLEKKVSFLEGMLNDDDKKKYDAYCKTICKYRNYFVIAHDRTGDGGMSMLYLGAFTNVEHAEKAAILEPAHSYQLVELEKLTILLKRLGLILMYRMVHFLSLFTLTTVWSQLNIGLSCHENTRKMNAMEFLY